jgi:hypothetical protein
MAAAYVSIRQCEQSIRQAYVSGSRSVLVAALCKARIAKENYLLIL